MGGLVLLQVRYVVLSIWTQQAEYGMEDPGGSSRRGRGSFEQRCVFLVYAGHFLRELNFSDTAK